MEACEDNYIKVNIRNKRILGRYFIIVAAEKQYLRETNVIKYLLVSGNGMKANTSRRL